MKPFTFLSLLMLACACNYSFGQLDSITVDPAFAPVKIVFQNDSISDLEVHVGLNDINFLGNVTVDLYEVTDNRYLQSLTFTKEELIAQSLVEGNGFTLTFESLSRSWNYRIETTIMDQNFAYYTPFINQF